MPENDGISVYNAILTYDPNQTEDWRYRLQDMDRQFKSLALEASDLLEGARRTRGQASSAPEDSRLEHLQLFWVLYHRLVYPTLEPPEFLSSDRGETRYHAINARQWAMRQVFERLGAQWDKQASLDLEV